MSREDDHALGGFDFSSLPPARPATAGNVPVRQWHSARPELEEIDSGDYLPAGPALLYVHDDHDPGTRTVTRVDHDPVRVDNWGRERALCRALLLHALHLLDEAEGNT